MKTKTKMPKAMYGKTMMQKGGMSNLDKLATRAKAAGIKTGEKVFGVGSKYRTANQENILKNDANLAKNRANAEKVEENKRKVAANKDKVAANKVKISAKKAGLSYKTGGMVNSNSKVSALSSAGSKGVKSGVNPKASASKVAKGPGKRSSSPKTEIPKAMYGRMMKKGGIKK